MCYWGTRWHRRQCAQQCAQTWSKDYHSAANANQGSNKKRAEISKTPARFVILCSLYEVTIEDPKVFTSRWKMAFNMNRRTEKDYEQWEDARVEGDRNVEQMLAGGRREKEAGRTGIHEHRRAR